MELNYPDNTTTEDLEEMSGEPDKVTYLGFDLEQLNELESIVKESNKQWMTEDIQMTIDESCRHSDLKFELLSKIRDAISLLEDNNG